MKANKVAILVKKAALECDKSMIPALSEYDLTPSQYRILKFLYTQPSKTVRQVDLEKYYSLTHPTAIGLLRALETKNFVLRTQNPEDARSRIVSLTDKALGMQGELEELGDRQEERLTKNLSEIEKTRLVFLLQKLLGMEK